MVIFSMLTAYAYASRQAIGRRCTKEKRALRRGKNSERTLSGVRRNAAASAPPAFQELKEIERIGMIALAPLENEFCA